MNIRNILSQLFCLQVEFTRDKSKKRRKGSQVKFINVTVRQDASTIDDLAVLMKDRKRK